MNRSILTICHFRIQIHIDKPGEKKEEGVIARVCTIKKERVWIQNGCK